MDKFAEMGKTELRAACKEAGIPYGKLTVGGMRDELRNKVAADYEAQRAALETERAAYAEMGKKMDLTVLDITGIEGHCPCCGIHLSNGVWTQDDANDEKQAKGWLTEKGSIACLGCGGSWGPAPIQPQKQIDRHTGTGLKIEKVREERNGVKRPSAGGKCRQVWDALDAYRAEVGEVPTIAVAKSIGEDEGWNLANVAIEFYQWRKFNGISGRK